MQLLTSVNPALPVAMSWLAIWSRFWSVPRNWFNNSQGHWTCTERRWGEGGGRKREKEKESGEQAGKAKRGGGMRWSALFCLSTSWKLIGSIWITKYGHMHQELMNRDEPAHGACGCIFLSAWLTCIVPCSLSDQACHMVDTRCRSRLKQLYTATIFSFYLPHCICQLTGQSLCFHTLPNALFRWNPS